MKSAEIREFTEQMEQTMLSPYAVLSAHSRGRTREEPSCPVRTAFQRDRDRIIHSRGFRRLKHKTQVFLAPEGDHYRTRLTHTLEVTQIARTIARALRLNEDLTEAIALGHDLGHTPFGHAGERALDSLCPSGFRHYQQSIRMVEHLEKGGQGLNLTYEVKNGIVCHTSGTQAESLEGRVVRLADKIAYINHDIEDACRAGVLTEEQIPREVRSVLGRGKSVRINRLVLDVIENSERDILMSNEVKEAFFALHSFMFESVYTNPQCKGEESKAIDMLARMYEYFISHPMEMPNEYLAISWQEGADRAVCDYLAGMSDYYALRTFKELFIPLSWRE